MTSLRESKSSKNKSRKLPLSTTRRSSKKDLEDLPEVLPSSRLEDPPTLRLVNSRIELKMHSVPPELPVTRVLSQVEDLLFSLLPSNWTKLREPTLTKTMELKSSRRHAPSQLELSAKTLALRDLSSLINYWSQEISREDSTPPRESTST